MATSTVTVYNIFKRDFHIADKVIAEELEKDGDFIHTEEAHDFCKIMNEYRQYLFYIILHMDLTLLKELENENRT